MGREPGGLKYRGIKYIAGDSRKLRGRTRGSPRCAKCSSERASVDVHEKGIETARKEEKAEV